MFSHLSASDKIVYTIMAITIVSILGVYISGLFIFIYKDNKTKKRK